MIKKDKTELKVGIFVVVAMIILGCMIILFNDENIFESRGYSINVDFSNISGIQIGGPVYLSGVEIGRIDDIQLKGGTQNVRLVLWIKGWVDLDKNSEITIGSRGVMGERFIEVIAPAKSSSEFLKDGDVLSGKDPITLTRIFKEGDKLLGELKNTIASINSIVSDKKIARDIEEVMGNINKALVSIHALADNATETIVSNRDDIARSIDLLNSNLDLLQDVFESLEGAEGTLGRLLKDDTIYRDFEALVKDIRANPWKLLRKTKEKKVKKEKEDDEDGKRPARRR